MMVVEPQTTSVAAGRQPGNTVDRESRSHSILLLGDLLPCLRVLRNFPEIAVAGELKTGDREYSAVVVGVGLSDHSDAMRVKNDLHARADECVMLAQRMPTLKHIILVLGSPDPADRMSAKSPDSLVATCDAVSETIQAEVEQRVGTYIIVTLIVAGRCNDPELLAERMIDRAIQTGVTDAASVVLWEEIREDRIGDVGLNQYI